MPTYGDILRDFGRYVLNNPHRLSEAMNSINDSEYRFTDNNRLPDAEIGMPDPENIFDPLHVVPEVEEDLIERPVLPSEYSGDIGFGQGQGYP